MSIIKDPELCRCLEVDLFREGIDLVDVFNGKVSMRRALNFAMTLDMSSLLMKALGKREIGSAVEWDQKDYFLASIANAVRNTEYLTGLLLWVKGDCKGSRPEQPDPIIPPQVEMPETQKPEIKFATGDEIAGLMWHANEQFRYLN